MERDGDEYGQELTVDEGRNVNSDGSNDLERQYFKGR